MKYSAIGWPNSTDKGGQCRQREVKRGTTPCHTTSYQEGDIIYTQGSEK